MELNQFMLEYDVRAKNGGVVSDIKSNWIYIQELRKDFLNLFTHKMGEDSNLINYPLHHIIFSQLYFLSDNLKIYLLIYFILSLSIPFLFYLCLIERFDNFNKYLLLLISSLVLYFPTFQYSAIWGNNHLTAIFFFLLGTLFHLKLIFLVHLISKYMGKFFVSRKYYYN